MCKKTKQKFRGSHHFQDAQMHLKKKVITVMVFSPDVWVILEMLDITQEGESHNTTIERSYGDGLLVAVWHRGQQ